MPTMTESPETGAFVPVDADKREPIKLAMQQLFLTGRVLPAGAHLFVRHVFRSAETKMIEAVYSFVLPRDAALRRFEVTGEGFTVRSELRPVEEAAETYEKGLERGHLAALARQYRDGLVNLSLGNIRPGEEVTVTLEVLAGVELQDDGLRLRFPFTLAPSYHAQARAGEVSPGAGEVELPAGDFGDLILPRFQKSAAGLHQVYFDLAVEAPWDLEEIGSPSHAVRITRGNRASLAPESDVPDRDLVLDVRSQARAAGVLAGRGEDGRRHFAVLIPSAEFGILNETARTVIFLIDRSGSMSGVPMEQARKSAAACLAALGPDDRFAIVAFDNECELFSPGLEAATPANCAAAQKFLGRIEARGGTELTRGIKEATRLLQKTGGDIFVLTDGQVFGSEDIIEIARATGCRLHTLGIGSASQDRFLALLARETNGISRFVTPRERVDRAALDLFASVSRPVATEVKVAGLSSDAAVSPDPASQVFAGVPMLIFGDCEAQVSASILMEFMTDGKTATREIRIETEENAPGETLRLLRGSRLITDAEARLGAQANAPGKRESGRWEKHLTALSRQYSLASRTMALVAVVERAGARPGQPPQTRVVPVALPQDMEFHGVFSAMTLGAAPPRAVAGPRYRAMHEQISFEAVRDEADDDESMACLSPASHVSMEESAAAPVPEIDDFDRLLELSIQLQPDGGMPGSDPGGRIRITLVALLAFVAEGHDTRSGSFRMHVKRMLEYLRQSLPGPLLPDEIMAVQRVIEAVRAGRRIAGGWLNLAVDSVTGSRDALDRAWKELRSATA